MSDRAKTLLAVLLLAILAGLLALRSGPDGAGGAASPAARTAAGRQAKRIGAEDVPVVIKSLAKPREGEVFVRERSLFGYAQSPEELAAIDAQRKADEEKRLREEEERTKLAAEQAAKKRIADEEAAKKRAEEQARLAEQLRLNPPKPVPPRFELEYIGIVGPMHDAFAILRGPGKKLSYAKAGDVVDRRFRIERVARFVLDITYTDPQFAGEIAQVLRIHEGAAAAAAAPSRR